jgi:hypothetical protein
MKIVKRPFPQVQARGVYLTEEWDVALNEPKENGVNPGGGDEGAPGPPGREQDK